MELDYQSIGKRIRMARTKMQITQEKLSEKVELSPTHMSNIETGTTRVSLTTIVNIANGLGVTVDDLLCDSIVHAEVQLQKEMQEILQDCDEFELRMICDMAQALKRSLRKDQRLKRRKQ